MDKVVSVKLKILSVIGLFAVVIMHSYFIESEKWESVHLINQFINNLTNFAVPMFFVISGFLFFQNIDEEMPFISIRKKILRRIKSLVLPYLFWCSFFILVIWITECFVSLNNDYFFPLRNRDWVGFLKFIYLKPAAFHLWYVRDLILLSLISPIIYVFFKRVNRPVAILVILSLCFFRIIPVVSWSIIWFCIGVYYALNNRIPFNNFSPKTGLMLLSCFGLSVFILTAKGISVSSEFWYSPFVIILGVAGLWSAIDLFPRIDRVLALGIPTFFVYCFHIPILSIVKKLLLPIASHSVIGNIFSFIFSALSIIIAGILISLALRKYAPSFYEFITGGR